MLATGGLWLQAKEKELVLSRESKTVNLAPVETEPVEHLQGSHWGCKFFSAKGQIIFSAIWTIQSLLQLADSAVLAQKQA